MHLRRTAIYGALIVCGCSGAVENDPAASAGQGGAGVGAGAPAVTSTVTVGVGGAAVSVGAGAGGSNSASGGSGATGGGEPCVPDTTEACYDGPSGTEGVGPCKGGVRTCLPDGSAFGACQGQGLPGVEDCTTSFDEDCAPATCPVALEWATLVTAPTAMATSVAIDAAGNVLVVGELGSTPLDLGGEPLTGSIDDSFVLKLDPDGNHLWSHSISLASRVAVDAAGNVLVGGVRAGPLTFDGAIVAGDGVAYVLELDPDGVPIWARRTAGTDPTNQYLGGLAALPDGDVALGLSFTGSLAIDGVSAVGEVWDMFVARLDGTTGSVVWGEPLPAPGNQYLDAVGVEASGDVLVTGRTWASPVDLGGGPIGGGGSALLIARLGGDGAHVWSAAADGEAPNPLEVAALPNGEVVWAGATAQLTDFGGGLLGGTDDTFLTKLSTNGEHLWSRDFTPTTSDSRPASIATSAAGELVIAGYFKDTIDFGTGPLDAGPFEGLDGFVTKLDAAGNTLWSAQLSSTQTVQVYEAAIAPTGEVIAVGYYVNDLDFWGVASTSSGGGLFIAKMGH